MKDPFYYLSKTPITDEMFERQGWEKVNEMEDGEEFYFYVLPLPKDNPDAFSSSTLPLVKFCL